MTPEAAQLAHQCRGVNFLDVLCALLDRLHDSSHGREVIRPGLFVHLQQLELNPRRGYFDPGNLIQFNFVARSARMSVPAQTVPLIHQIDEVRRTVQDSVFQKFLDFLDRVFEARQPPRWTRLIDCISCQRRDHETESEVVEDVVWD
jgi:hypothetical protein